MTIIIDAHPKPNWWIKPSVRISKEKKVFALCYGIGILYIFIKPMAECFNDFGYYKEVNK